MSHFEFIEQAAFRIVNMLAENASEFYDKVPTVLQERMTQQLMEKLQEHNIGPKHYPMENACFELNLKKAWIQYNAQFE